MSSQAKPNLLQRLKDAIACSNGGDGMSFSDDFTTSSAIANSATTAINATSGTMASTASSSFFFNTARSPT